MVQTGVDATGKPVYEENTTPIPMKDINAYWYHVNNGPNSWENIILPKDFLKLRDVTLSYRLPGSVAQKISASNISISLIARNLLLWVPQRNTFVDPELTNLGNDLPGELGEFGGAPSFKAFGAALRISF